MDDRFNSTNAFNQYIPNQQEVVQYFNAKGITKEYEPVEWFLNMQTAKWLSANGNKIMNWRYYANLKIEELKRCPVEKKEYKIINSNMHKIAEEFYELHLKVNIKNKNKEYIAQLVDLLNSVKEKNKFEDDLSFYKWLCDFDFGGDFSLTSVNETINN